MSYVDGYILPVPKKNVRALQAHGGNGPQGLDEARRARLQGVHRRRSGRQVWQTVHEHDEIQARRDGWCSPTSSSSPASHRDQVNKKVMKEMNDMGATAEDMPFDMKRMVYGGFKTLVE